MIGGQREHLRNPRRLPSSLSDLRLMDELRRGFFTPPVLVLVLVLLCGS